VGHNRRADTLPCVLNKLDMASLLSNLSKARGLQLPLDLLIGIRPKRPTSTVRIWGAIVGHGGSKYSSNASRRLVSASSSVPPWLATSTSRHCATTHGPSRQRVAVKVRFICFHHLRCLFVQSTPFRVGRVSSETPSASACSQRALVRAETYRGRPSRAASGPVCDQGLNRILCYNTTAASS
jgi:hypothetical protein